MSNSIEYYKSVLVSKGMDSSLATYLYNCLVDEDRLEEYDKLFELVLFGNPIQYVLGNVNFYGNKIIINKNVLIPRFETELLVEKTIKYINEMFNGDIDILEIGAGSGCISISLKKELVGSNITSCDISNDALEVARENALLNKTDINFINSDIFSNVSGKYDVIISNPPYISYDEEIMDIVRDNEPSIALFASSDGLYFYDKIISGCLDYVKEKFLIAFEIGYKQGNDIKRLVYKYLSDVNISIESDYSGRDRYVFIYRK